MTGQQPPTTSQPQLFWSNIRWVSACSQAQNKSPRKQLKCENPEIPSLIFLLIFVWEFFCCCLSWLQIQLLEMLTNRQKSSQDPYLALASKPNFKLKDDVAGFEGLALRPLKAAAEVAESAVGAVPPKASSYQALT